MVFTFLLTRFFPSGGAGGFWSLTQLSLGQSIAAQKHTTTHPEETHAHTENMHLDMHMFACP